MNLIPRPNYRPDIDGIRAIAVLSVVVFHAFPRIMQGGFVGVDIFFVISGFLITNIIFKELENGTWSFLNFYKRRIRRIFPAIILVLATALIAGWFLLFAKEYTNLGKHIASTTIFISNFVYMKEAGFGYFDINSNLKPLLHLWSLGIEEQFYLILPAILVFSFKRTRKISLIIFSLFTLSFLANYTGLFTESEAFYLPLTRFWELLSGSLLASFYLKKENYIKNLTTYYLDKIPEKIQTLLPNIFSITGIIIIITSTFLIESLSFQASIALFPVLGTVFLIASGPKAWINRKILAQPILVWIGLISYPLYLWHWPLLSFARIVHSGELSTNSKYIIIFISFLLAWLTYRLVEKPLRRNEQKSVIIILTSLIFIIGIGGLFIYKNNGVNFRFPKQEQLLKTVFTGENRLNPLCQKIFGKDNFKYYCHITGTGSKSIFILGDSHSQAIFTGYNKQFSDLGYTVIHLAMPQCPFFIPENNISTQTEEIWRKQIKECNVTMNKIFSIINTYNPSGVLLSNNSWDARKPYFKTGMNDLFSRIPKKTKIFWFLEYPRLPFDVEACVGRPFGIKNYSNNCSFPRKIHDSFTNNYIATVTKIIKNHSNVTSIDPADILCDTQICRIIINNKSLYSDRSHLNINGGDYLAKEFPVQKLFPDLKN